ncbi:MAG TPA: CAP domain-containing protein [Bacillota bacterium]|nr:CAP domain-containing protein [Bacillota bacterium]
MQEVPVENPAEKTQPPAGKKPEAKQQDPPPAKKTPTPAPPAAGEDQAGPSQNQADLYEEEAVSLLNSRRRQRGLPDLKTSREISRLARLKSEDMRDRNYFASTSPTYGTASQMLQSNGIRYNTLVEKIAGGIQTPAQLVDYLLKDSRYQQNFFSSHYNCIAVGYAGGKGKYYHYWTVWLLDIPGPAAADTRAQYEEKVLELVNKERAARGLRPLQWDEELRKVARAKSEDMRDRNYFAHDSPTYGSLAEMLSTFGVKYRFAGENLAAGQKTPQEVVAGWMNSDGHRENILNPRFTHLGVGYADGGGKYFYYWTQIFVER